MPASFEISASTGRYAVEVDPGLLSRILQDDGHRVFIADAFIVPLLTAGGIDPIAIVADEPAKSLERISDIVTALRARGANRSTTLIAIGGGVVQDIAGFVASIYMRGIAWRYVPTTLLSMADSCIGGKSSINVGDYKNIVGTFHPPQAVLIDPQLTRTLDAEARVAGLLEAAKICFCRSPEVFDNYLALGPEVDASDTVLTDIVGLSLRSKKWFIEVDEFDRAERLVLNFGHTFGHAIEAASQFRISHGIAVGLGIEAAIALGEAIGRDYGAVLVVARLRRHITDLLLRVTGLDEALATITTAALLAAFESDKKHSQTDFAVIVISEQALVERLLLPRDARSAQLIARAFGAMTDRHVAASGSAVVRPLSAGERSAAAEPAKPL